VKFGIFTSLTGTTWPDVLDLWRRAEFTGWDIACVTDHFMPIRRHGRVLCSSRGARYRPSLPWCLECVSPDQIRDKLHELQAAGATTVFIATMFRPLAELRRDMDRFISEIAPDFR